MIRAMLRVLAFSCAVFRGAHALAQVDPPAPAVVDAPANRMSARYGQGLVALGPDDDGHYPDSGGASTFGIGYARRLLPNLETGAELEYDRVRWDRQTPAHVRAMLLVRPFLRVGRDHQTELGFRMSAGPAIHFLYAESTPIQRRTYVGFAFTLGVDARFWLTPRAGLGLGVDASGYFLEDHGPPSDAYLQASTVYLATNVHADLVIAFERRPGR